MTSSPSAAVSDVLNSHVPNTATELIPTTECDRRDLSEMLAAVPDPRRRRGVRHPFTPLLAAVTCAMLAGSRSFAAIAEWIADLPAAARTDLGMAGPVPAASTLWRLLTPVDPAALQDALGTWLRARPPGRPAPAPPATGPGRGRQGHARHPARGQPGPPARRVGPRHLARSRTSQRRCETNEIPCFRTVLDQIDDLNDVIITADAIHAQTGHVTYLRERGAHLLVCGVKANQPDPAGPAEGAALEGHAGRAQQHHPGPRADRGAN